MRCQPASRSIQLGRRNSGILQVDRLEQLVQRNVRVHSIQSCRNRSHETKYSGQGTCAEAGEAQIEPGHLGLHRPDGAQQSGYIAMLFKTPAARHLKARQFIGGCEEIISQHRQINTPLMPKLVRHVESILIERMATRRKRSD